MTKKHDYLTQKQFKEIKNKLLGDKERILNKGAEDQARYCLDKNELSDPLDEASVNIQTSHELRFRNRENFYLKKVNKSLEMISSPEYGHCEDCNDQIGFERLFARPTAELCIACKEENELLEKNNFFHKKSKSLGKTLSEIGKR